MVMTLAAMANLKWAANLQGFAGGVMHNPEDTPNELHFDQWVRQVDWLLRPPKFPSIPAWRKFQFAYYSLPNDCYEEHH
jgi:hypothetical protein